MTLHRSALVWTWVLVATGCSETTAPAPSGSLALSVQSSGPSPDMDGYRLSIDGGPGRPVATTGHVRIPRLSVGPHQVELTGLAINYTGGAYHALGAVSRTGVPVGWLSYRGRGLSL